MNFVEKISIHVGNDEPPKEERSLRKTAENTRGGGIGGKREKTDSIKTISSVKQMANRKNMKDGYKAKRGQRGQEKFEKRRGGALSGYKLKRG